ncbi:hypothetical protein KI387_018548, partial [Taxus chinensis]
MVATSRGRGLVFQVLSLAGSDALGKNGGLDPAGAFFPATIAGSMVAADGGKARFVGGGGRAPARPKRGGLSFLVAAANGCKTPPKPMAYAKQTPKVSFGDENMSALGHLAPDCQMVKKRIKGRVSWWKDFKLDNLVVFGLEDNDSDNVSVGHKENQEEILCEATPSPTNLAKKNHMEGKHGASSIRSLSSKVNQIYKNKVALEIQLPVHLDKNVDPNMGNRWKVVNNKEKGKTGSSPTTMSLRSQKGLFRGSQSEEKAENLKPRKSEISDFWVLEFRRFRIWGFGVSGGKIEKSTKNVRNLESLNPER